MIMMSFFFERPEKNSKDLVQHLAAITGCQVEVTTFCVSSCSDVKAEKYIYIKMASDVSQ